jgi:hypothetical protein
MVTSRLAKVISSAMHEEQLHAHIIKRQGWTSSVFDKVDWEAHNMAYTSHRRTTRISISKLTHGLYHTKYEAHKLYGEDVTCPCCNLLPETLDHVFCCSAPTVTENRVMAKDKLRDSLSRANTPEKLLDTIMHGICSWDSKKPGEQQTPLFRGSVRPDDIGLVQAFHEQSAIGWDQFLRGRISRKWGEVYLMVGKPKTEVASSTRWTKQLVLALWDYAVSLWKFRNGEVHGHTIEENKEKERSQLQKRVDIEFRLYQVDPFIVSPQFGYLFTKKSQRERENMDRDSIDCWLRSVEEAKKHQAVFRQSLGKITKFFKPKSRSPNKRRVEVESICLYQLMLH